MREQRIFIIFTLFCWIAIPVIGQQSEITALDRQIQAFLNSRYGQWHDMNVPYADGQLLFDLIVKNRYTRALEIGTSTGHSTIWMAWALSKTGGKLITIEIDETRYREAIKNFKEAGVSEYIDARLADAHDLVPKLKGPFDFVFSDADQSWYRTYFLALVPKLELGGCYTSHNVSDRFGNSWNTEYLQFLKQLPNFITTIDNSGGGMAISYKRANH
ncbi:MAG: class I SAM-dependent methyltransferase [Bacteroidales bacterium]|nr:class I SAM-dependent methyltransferase [Bacteroidales bacterium]MBN2698388.1 class I SAM-dependent methyltransferase [Bacteroidales bacterium]